MKEKEDHSVLFGFGHRVYKNYDPRAKLIQKTCHEVLEELDLKDDKLFKLALALEKIALEDEYFIKRKLYPNVDFYSGIVYKALGIPVSMFTAIFALARTVGWIAQWNELIGDPDQKIGRPRQLFTGPTPRDFVPMDEEESDEKVIGRCVAVVTPCKCTACAMMKEFLGNSYLFGSNAPFIEALYESYLKDPQSVEPRWRSYFDELQRLDDGPPDVSHEEVQQRFIDLAKTRRPRARRRRRPAAARREAVRRLPAHHRLPHAGRAPRATRSARAAQEKPHIPELDPAFYGLTEADMDTVFSTGTLVWKPRSEAARDPRVPEGHVLRLDRRRVHVHDRHGAEALGAGAARVDPLHAVVRRRVQEAHPRAADGGGDAREVHAHALRRAEALLAAKAANR